MRSRCRRALARHDDLDAALADYQAVRMPIARKIVDAANTSATWYEHFAQKLALPPLDFAFDYVTRSGRIDIERLRALSPKFIEAWENRPAAAPIRDPVPVRTSACEEIGYDKTRHPNCRPSCGTTLPETRRKPRLSAPAGASPIGS